MNEADFRACLIMQFTAVAPQQLETNAKATSLSILTSQRMSGRLVPAVRRHSGGCGFDPWKGRISAYRLKKNPRLLHVQSTVESGLTHKATGLVYGWGRGSGGFLACCEKVFYLSNNAVGAVLPPQVKFFSFSLSLFFSSNTALLHYSDRTR